MIRLGCGACVAGSTAVRSAPWQRLVSGDEGALSPVLGCYASAFVAGEAVDAFPACQAIGFDQRPAAAWAGDESGGLHAARVRGVPAASRVAGSSSLPATRRIIPAERA